jgi:hypothetical protein
VALFDCANGDVTSSAPVTVHLVTTAGASGVGVNLINEVDDYAGVGDAGGVMVLVDGIINST